MTVVVSSDTDIYISPGLYGDCLPTVATGGTADSFRAGRVFSSPPSSCSHTRCGAETGCRGAPWEWIGARRDSRHTDAMAVVKVT
ncbi:hypothetical protein GCM10010261_07670 [Streptomyces pilosus]|uniref:Uncharacterized protein n=1 Tax=Streptomyces pilosus TaxID=28893 RepID=A0A918ERJ1_9ACTN|nr:hypothetical protein GCM10010280_03890 [Streptomyces pilosus]GGV37328.1 hypothetical protein GCM10010261_07670 [Streptomyces pilosus]